MHPHSADRAPRNFRDFLQFLPPSGIVEPRINPVHAYFASCPYQFRNLIRYIGHVVAAGPKRWSKAIWHPSRAPCKGNYEECGWMVFVNAQITVEFIPKILSNSKMNQWQLCCC